MNYSYADGSGNKYRLKDATLQYIPMTPEQSSSGTYSGGDPFTLELEKMNLIKLIDVFERALWSEEDHTKMRTMGSGTLYKKVGEESSLIYLRMRSGSMEEINALLKSLKPE